MLPNLLKASVSSLALTLLLGVQALKAMEIEEKSNKSTPPSLTLSLPDHPKSEEVKGIEEFYRADVLKNNFKYETSEITHVMIKGEPDPEAVKERLQSGNITTVARISSYSVLKKPLVEPLVELLKGNNTVKTLILPNTNIGGAFGENTEHLQAIVDIVCENKMTTLSLRGNKFGSEEAIELIAKLVKEGSLTALDLANTNLHNDMQKVIEELLQNKTLTKLNLSDIFNSSGVFGEDIEKGIIEVNETINLLTQRKLEIEKLIFKTSILTEELSGINEDLKLLKADQEELIGQRLYTLPNLLKANTPLEYLNLSRSNIDGKKLAQIAEAMKSNINLKELEIYSCGIVDKDCGHLANLIKNNKGLISLNVSNVSLSGERFSCGWSLKSLRAIEEAVKENKTLTELKLPIDFETKGYVDVLNRIAEKLEENKKK